MINIRREVSMCTYVCTDHNTYVPLISVSSLSVRVKMREVRCGHIIQNTANIALPSSAIISPRDVRIDVRATSFAPHDSCGSEVYHIDGVVACSFITGHRLDYNS